MAIFHYTFTIESVGERILKIGQHLPKTEVMHGQLSIRDFFYETPCIWWFGNYQL